MSADGSIYVRNPEDVASIIKHAKLDARKLTSLTQALYYPAADIVADNLRLLELDQHMLEQIKAGRQLHFKGGLSEKVVLVTDERTYDVKAAEISNSLLLVPDLKLAAATSTTPLLSPDRHQRSHDSSLEDAGEEDDVEPRRLEHCNVLKICHEYIECREIKPRFRKLNDLLLLTRYSGPEHESNIDRKLLFTFDQMLDTIQCSRKEFVEGLRTVRAFELDGYLRVCGHEYEYRIMHQMLALLEENSWPLDGVERDETVRALEGIAPHVIVEALFELYTRPSDNQPGKYIYDVHLVARLIAQNILRPNLRFDYDEFMSTWQDALPESMPVDVKYLRGLGIIDREGVRPAVRSLAESFLPTTLHERMKSLFKAKRKWTQDEIEPYMACFTTPTQSVSMLLAKFARCVTENGVRYYVSKH